MPEGKMPRWKLPEGGNETPSRACVSTILHESPDYVVRFNRVSDEPISIITFHPWTESPALDGPFFGETFFLRRGINAIGIKPARNDWYQGAAMANVIAAIRDATPDMRLVGYGGSMGAYAVINFANDLGLDDLLAIGPQFSIDPAAVPFETRWLTEARGLRFRADKIGGISRTRKGWIVFDPRTVDGRHAALILARHEFTPIRICFADHHPLTVLRETGLLEPLLSDLIHDRLDRREFVRSLRARRRDSPWVWLQCSRHLRDRGAPTRALRAVEIAKSLRGKDDGFPFDFQHAGLLAEADELEAALALIAPYRDDARHGDTARVLVGEWRTRLLLRRIAELEARESELKARESELKAAVRSSRISEQALESELAAIRASVSWRLTRPLRSVRRRMLRT